ncbi:hypothetical protein A7982_13279 [Minicystis rosea]|nr:hypothetical protein A7982_13279 [Minicystis rosea]
MDEMSNRIQERLWDPSLLRACTFDDWNQLAQLRASRRHAILTGHP